MKNTYKLVWTEEALNGLKDIFNYLERKFSEKDIRKFAKKLDKQLELLNKSPETFAFTNSSKKVEEQ